MHKVIIIGAGSAGMAAALQLKRYDIDALLLEANNPGGLLNNANKVENYLGFPKGITGTELINHFIAQLTYHKIKITKDLVEQINFNNDFFEVHGAKQTYKCEKLILATGTSPIKSDLKLDKKIFYEVIDLLDAKDKHIIIIGAGDAAFDYAVNLARNNQVTILNRSAKIKALPILQKIAAENPNINYRNNVSINDYLKLNDKYDYLLFAIGRKPNKPKYSNEIALQETELIKRKKIFLIGDIKNDIYRQTSLAVADGIKAAMEIALENNNENNQ